jgi:hypothetical protein
MEAVWLADLDLPAVAVEFGDPRVSGQSAWSISVVAISTWRVR